MYVDIDNKQVTLLMVPQNYMNFIQSLVNRDKIGYQVFFKDGTTGQLYECQAWLSSQNITVVQEMYIKYFRTTR